jgi:hypothetical protein
MNALRGGPDKCREWTVLGPKHLLRRLFVLRER